MSSLAFVNILLNPHMRAADNTNKYPPDYRIRQVVRLILIVLLMRVRARRSGDE